MPYEIKRRTARITFEGTDYDGAEMHCRFDVDMGVFLAYQRVAGDANVENIAEMFRQFGDEILIDWDIEESGVLIPATGEGMMKLPVAFAGAVVRRWLEEMAQPSAPLGSPSTNGATSEELSTPTATPSRSRSSSSRRK